MSEIQKYRVRGYRDILDESRHNQGDIIEVVFPDDRGKYVKFSDLAPYVEAKVREAVDAERERCKEFGNYRRTKAGIAICPFFVWQSENIGDPDKSPKEGDVSLIYCDHPNNPDKHEGNCAAHLCPLAAVRAAQKKEGKS